MDASRYAAAMPLALLGTPDMLPDTYPNEWSVPTWFAPQTFVAVPGATIRIRSCHGCGVPGDCYCHENCNSNEPASLCNECAADWQVTRDEDHREAIANVMAEIRAVVPNAFHVRNGKMMNSV